MLAFFLLFILSDQKPLSQSRESSPACVNLTEGPPDDDSHLLKDLLARPSWTDLVVHFATQGPSDQATSLPQPVSLSPTQSFLALHSPKTSLCCLASHLPPHGSLASHHHLHGCVAPRPASPWRPPSPPTACSAPPGRRSHLQGASELQGAAPPTQTQVPPAQYHLVDNNVKETY